MIFVPLIFVAIFLYLKEYRIFAFLIIYWLATSGFSCVPEEAFDIGPISKGIDFAFFALGGIFVLDTIYVRKFLQKDGYTTYLWIFYGFLFICICNSLFILKLPLADVIKGCRGYFFWLAYFVFRRIELEQLEKLLKYLFVVATVLAFIYLLQLFTGDSVILTKGATSVTYIFGQKLTRYYNLPMGSEFFALMALFCNPFKGWLKVITKILLVGACLATFHRNIIGSFVLIFALSYVLQLSHSKRVKVFIVAGALLVPALVLIGHQIVNSRTFVDIQSVMSGRFTDTELDLNDMDDSSTFTFRIGLTFERMLYLSEHPEAQVLGAGLLTESSKETDRRFDFFIGLQEEKTGRTTQIESGDISYPALFIRLGYLGTILYLSLFVGLSIFFYKNQKNKYAFFSFLYLVMLFVLSFFSAILSFPVSYLLPLIAFHIVAKENLKNKTE